MNTVMSEIFALKIYKVNLPDQVKLVPGPVDNVSRGILHYLNEGMLTRYLPLAIVGDGNCMFRSVSRALYGSEDQHLLIRLLTSLEMAGHRTFYDVNSKECLKMLGKSKDTPHFSYQEAMQRVCSPTMYMGLLHLFGISGALSIPIQSYYPSSSSPPTLQNKVLNVTVRGRGVMMTDPKVTIMWSSSSMPRNIFNFNPDHIVVLCPFFRI